MYNDTILILDSVESILRPIKETGSNPRSYGNMEIWKIIMENHYETTVVNEDHEHKLVIPYGIRIALIGIYKVHGEA